MNTIKEIPMAFNASMVRALLEGNKAQSHRLKFCGQVGDLIWVQETVATNCDPHWIMYKADMRALRIASGEVFDSCAVSDLQSSPKWLPTIEMPRYASRISLRVISVRKRNHCGTEKFVIGLEKVK